MSTHAAHRKLVEDFFASWSKGFDAMIAGFQGAVSRDCLLQQTRTPDLRGIEAIVTFLTQTRSAGIFETIDVECRNLIVTDRHVVSERVDHLRKSDRTLVATCPCVGIMEIAGGKIVAWRDYFDSADMQPAARSFIART